MENKVNELSGKEWLQNSFSIWRGLSKIQEEKTFRHPASFPISLCEKVIKTFSATSGKVIDPFNGIGSTTKSCEILNREAVGIDLSEGFCKIARKRISKKNIKIIANDNIVELAKQPENYFDLCFTSPPYWDILNMSRSVDNKKNIKSYSDKTDDIGTIRRGDNETNISIDIPHKKQLTENGQDVLIYVKASIADIKNMLEPLVGTSINFVQSQHSTVLSLTKRNEDFLIREILRLVGNSVSHENIRIHKEIFNYSDDMKKLFLRGFADTTGYIRRSNYFFKAYMHRVYLEIPQNWFLVVDVCNLLKSVNISVQGIDWAHPNMRDGNLKKYNQGFPDFWKKEHQIKIFANEFLPISFSVSHKIKTLYTLSQELKEGLLKDGKDVSKTTHRFYWETRENNKSKPNHPSENDNFIPASIRGNHYNSWKDIAKNLRYDK